MGLADGAVLVVLLHFWLAMPMFFNDLGHLLNPLRLHVMLHL